MGKLTQFRTSFKDRTVFKPTNEIPTTENGAKRFTQVDRYNDIVEHHPDKIVEFVVGCTRNNMKIENLNKKIL